MLRFQFAARLMGKDSGDENLKDTFHFTFVLLLHIGASVGFGIHKNMSSNMGSTHWVHSVKL